VFHLNPPRARLQQCGTEPGPGRNHRRTRVPVDKQARGVIFWLWSLECRLLRINWGSC